MGLVTDNARNIIKAANQILEEVDTVAAAPFMLQRALPTTKRDPRAVRCISHSLALMANDFCKPFRDANALVAKLKEFSCGGNQMECRRARLRAALGPSALTALNVAETRCVRTCAWQAAS